MLHTNDTITRVKFKYYLKNSWWSSNTCAHTCQIAVYIVCDSLKYQNLFAFQFKMTIPVKWLNINNKARKQICTKTDFPQNEKKFIYVLWAQGWIYQMKINNNWVKPTPIANHIYHNTISLTIKFSVAVFAK